MFRCSRARLGALLSMMLLLSSCNMAMPGSIDSVIESLPTSSTAASGENLGENVSSEQTISGQEEPAQSSENENGNEREPSASEEVQAAVSAPGSAEEPAAEVFQPVYDFSQPVPEREAVDNTYFSDAAFVGDSRTDGLLIYSGVGCGENLTSNGLSIFKLAEKKAIERDGVSYTLLEALDLKEYGKVYLSLGVNELGMYDDEGFYRAYCAAIDAIRASQPNAVIYIQGLIPLNEEVVKSKGGKDYLRNDHLLVYNDLMKKAAQEKRVAFLDLNPYFADETGALPAEATGDGVHLKGAYYKQWLEYLKCHTVEYDTLYPEGEMEEEPAQSDAEMMEE